MWSLDVWTWGWIVWILFFVGWETATLLSNNNQELTEHLRPVFLSAPPVYFLTMGLWLWLGWHFLIEAGTPLKKIVEEISP